MKIVKDGVVYRLYNSFATVEGLDDPKMLCVSIPEVVDGLVVQKISDFAFFGLGIISITLPDGLQEIGTQAFAKCKSLKIVKFQPNSMLRSSTLEIKEAAFDECWSLEIFQTKKKLILRDKSFYNCSCLRFLDNIELASGEVFFNCPNLNQIDLCDKCDLTMFSDIDSKIKIYYFCGNATISEQLAQGIKDKKIAITCFPDSNICELAYNGICVNVEELPF